jgi:membrane protease YdiL (CAAX protease family)
MAIPAVHLVREMFSGENRRPTIALLTSSVGLAAWYLLGNYRFWAAYLTDETYSPGVTDISAGTAALVATVVLLGIVPLLVVKFVLRERLFDYGVRMGNWRFALVCSLLATPLMVLIGYSSSRSPAFQAVYPTDPAALKSPANLAIHLVEQLAFYAAWEFHFRGFLQHALEKKSGIATAIWVQTLVSTVAHFGKPAPEAFGAIIGGVLWGALAWRTRSLMAGIYQHWLLGAALDFFIYRSTAG